MSLVLHNRISFLLLSKFQRLSHEPLIQYHSFTYVIVFSELIPNIIILMKFIVCLKFCRVVSVNTFKRCVFIKLLNSPENFIWKTKPIFVLFLINSAKYQTKYQTHLKLAIAGTWWCYEIRNFFVCKGQKLMGEITPNIAIL